MYTGICITRIGRFLLEAAVGRAPRWSSMAQNMGPTAQGVMEESRDSFGALHSPSIKNTEGKKSWILFYFETSQALLSKVTNINR